MADGATGRRPLGPRLADLGLRVFTCCCFHSLRALVWLPFQVNCLLKRLRARRSAGS